MIIHGLTAHIQSFGLYRDQCHVWLALHRITVTHAQTPRTTFTLAYVWCSLIMRQLSLWCAKWEKNPLRTGHFFPLTSFFPFGAIRYDVMLA